MNNIATIYKNNKIYSLILALISSYGFLYYISKITSEYKIYGSIIALPLIICFYLIWKHVINKKNANTVSLIAVGLFTFFFCLMLSFGYQLLLFDPILGISKSFLDSSIISFAFFPLFFTIYIGLNRLNFNIIDNHNNKKERRLLFVFFAIICAVWFLVWLAMWPGMFGYDGTYWYAFMDAGHLNAKFSIPYQMIFYFFLSNSHKLFGNYEIGFSVFTLVQSAFLLYVVFRLLEFVQRYMGNTWLILSSIFYIINFPIIILSMSSAQDAPFSAAFAMCVLLLINLSRNPDEFWKSRINTIEFVFWLLMLFIWRNNGVYSILFVVICSILGIKYYKKYLIITLLAVTIVYEIYSGPFLTLVGANKSTTVTEMMSVPATQLAFVWHYDKDNLSEEELNEVYYYIPQSFLESDNFLSHNRISDSFKSKLNDEAIKDDPIRFAKLYSKLGLKFPKDYLIAHLDLTFGLWYTDVHYYDTKMYHPYIEYVSNSEEYLHRQNEDYITTLRFSKFPLLQHLMDHLFGPDSPYGAEWPMAFSDSYILSILYKPGLYFWAFVFMTLYSVSKKRWWLLLPISLFAGLLLTYILGPVVLFRYVAPIMLSAPLTVSMFVVNKQK